MFVQTPGKEQKSKINIQSPSQNHLETKHVLFHDLNPNPRSNLSKKQKSSHWRMDEESTSCYLATVQGSSRGNFEVYDQVFASSFLPFWVSKTCSSRTMGIRAASLESLQSVSPHSLSCFYHASSLHRHHVSFIHRHHVSSFHYSFFYHYCASLLHRFSHLLHHHSPLHLTSLILLPFSLLVICLPPSPHRLANRQQPHSSLHNRANPRRHFRHQKAQQRIAEQRSVQRRPQPRQLMRSQRPTLPSGCW